MKLKTRQSVPPKPLKAAAKEDAVKRHKTEIDLFEARKAALAALAVGEDDRHDASPSAFIALKANRADLIDKATTPELLRPALDRAVVDAWSLTSLREHPGRPEVAPWLRGWVEDEEPQTEVVWRRWLPWRNDEARPVEEDVEGFFETARPHASEILQTLTRSVVDTLIERANDLLKQRREGESDTSAPPKTQDGIIVLTSARELREAKTAGDLAALADKAKKQEKKQLFDLLANATVVVSASLGGLGESGLLDPKVADPPPCIDDGDNSWVDNGMADIGFRVLGPGEVPTADWREVYSFPLTYGEEEDQEHLTISVLRTEVPTRLGMSSPA